jgi:hypothetical protein
MRRIAKSMRKREENYEDAVARTAPRDALPREALVQFGNCCRTSDWLERADCVGELGDEQHNGRWKNGRHPVLHLDEIHGEFFG